MRVFHAHARRAPCNRRHDKASNRCRTTPPWCSSLALIPSIPDLFLRPVAPHQADLQDPAARPLLASSALPANKSLAAPPSADRCSPPETGVLVEGLAMGMGLGLDSSGGALPYALGPGTADAHCAVSR